MGMALVKGEMFSSNQHGWPLAPGMTWEHYKDPKNVPEFECEPSHDPHKGFSGQRKEREYEWTEEEVRAAKVPHERRDYCAHKLLKYYHCYEKNFPYLSYYCSHEKHDYIGCKHEDYILRMKEYEREWRMNKRAERIAKRKAREGSVEAE